MIYKLRSSAVFDKWLSKIKDRSVRNRLLARLNRVETGNFGDFKPIDQDLYEMRFFFGAGIRIYFTIQNDQVVLLLTGGDKSTQNKDIAAARKLLLEIEMER
jgi:putative addiction module killer protein